MLGLRIYAAVLVLVLALAMNPCADAQNTGNSVYIDDTGKTTLTNRHDKYRNDSEYTEVEIHFDPIYIPTRFRSARSARAYSVADIRGLVDRYANSWRVDPAIIMAIIQAESSGNPYAVSKAGARGLMQLMPGTAREMRVTNSFDPAQNIAGGTQYYAKLLDAFKGNVDYAIAAYNAGPGAVKKHGGVPPYSETRNYLSRVKRFAAKYGADISVFKWNPDAVLASASPATPDAAYTLQLYNGTTQYADLVQEANEHYLLEYQGRKYRVRKDLVQQIDTRQ